jgi:hypothetical protein
LSAAAIEDSQASRGGPRKPLPRRSMTRNTASPVTDEVTSKIIFASVEKA